MKMLWLHLLCEYDEDSGKYIDGKGEYHVLNDIGINVKKVQHICYGREWVKPETEDEEMRHGISTIICVDGELIEVEEDFETVYDGLEIGG